MSTLRHRAREIAFQFLFHDEIAKESNIHKFFEHFDVALNIRAFANELAAGTLINLTSIDEAITKKMNTSWRFSRLALVDKAIIRMAVYEMLFRTDIPAGVAINEAVELAKRYGNESSPSFINGILDSIHLGHAAIPQPEVRQESTTLPLGDSVTADDDNRQPQAV